MTDKEMQQLLRDLQEIHDQTPCSHVPGCHRKVHRSKIRKGGSTLGSRLHTSSAFHLAIVRDTSIEHDHPVEGAGTAESLVDGAGEPEADRCFRCAMENGAAQLVSYWKEAIPPPD